MSLSRCSGSLRVIIQTPTVISKGPLRPISINQRLAIGRLLIVQNTIGGAEYLRLRLYTDCCRGFTLLEMLLVLVIAVTATVLVVPNFSSGLDSIRLRAASREIASALRYLRGHAVTTNRQTEFNLNVKTNVYRITGKSKAYSVPGAIKMRLTTADSEISDRNSGSIRFYPDGSSSGGRVTLVAGAHKHLVDINWLTGHVVMRTEVDD